MGKQPLLESNQNFWELASIQSSAQSVPAMLVGWVLAQQFGEGSALIAIFIGNLVIWLVGLSIVSMTFGEREHAIENVKGYLGAPSALIASLVIIIAFLAWYALEIRSITTVLGDLFEKTSFSNGSLDVRIGAAIGFFTALLSLGGIKLIKKFNVAIFPFLLFYLFYCFVSFGYWPKFENTWKISLSATVSVIVLNLPGFVNLPTFFRHSRSKADSFLALTFITVFDTLFQASGMFLSSSANISHVFSMSNLAFYKIITAFFIVSSSICLNLVNIYFASAGGEVLLYKNWGAKEYTIIGLLGTAVYTFLQLISPIVFLGNLTNSFISALGVSLLVAFLTKLIVKHRPRRFEKIITNFCWFFGCLVALILQIRNPNDPNRALLMGVNATILVFLGILFIEETFWSIWHLGQKVFYKSANK